MQQVKKQKISLSFSYIKLSVSLFLTALIILSSYGINSNAYAQNLQNAQGIPGSANQGTIPPAALEEYPALDPRLIGVPIIKTDVTASLVLYSQAVANLKNLNEEKAALGTRIIVLEPEQLRAKALAKRATDEYNRVYKASRDLLITQYSEASNMDQGHGENIIDRLRKSHQSVKVSQPLHEWVKKAKSKMEAADKYVVEVEEAFTKSKERLGTIDADIEKAANEVNAQRSVVRSGLPSAAIEGLDIPVLTMDAYFRAEKNLAAEKPECGITWWALAGIGRAESNHGRYAGRGLDQNGTTQPAIIGVALNGNGFAAIADTDDGLLDGDLEWDRAVGVMQFIPGTWKRWGSDGDGDGIANPQNVYDGALSAARYLCASSNMTTEEGRRKAFMSYNHSKSYVDFVATRGHEYEVAAQTIFNSPQNPLTVPVQ